ncbi:nuclear transport factor 2 family protein [Chryseobacterium gambrini]|uniref:Predicted SnoaL-like aldol condensation-catalyzing enzyme n=1 Tax=Chryseobacterium gambrini TaxID=373672 RepID=A0A1N7MK06_9FLAO|nr:nuclear transport factor 2 family protein [Chryseobacterium gambrini]SIS86443.1 Predicted SnoaL-like aldol condensation-catalyzing enzyme [Chryseobacterium gambrini]
MTNRELVITAVTAVFVDRDLSALDQYFDSDYIQHNPALPNGKKVLNPTLKEDFKYEVKIVTENEDIVMAHGRFSNGHGKNYIAVDIFKVEDEKVVEH